MKLILGLLYFASLGLLGLRLAHDAAVIFETQITSRAVRDVWWPFSKNTIVPNFLMCDCPPGAVSVFCSVAGTIDLCVPSTVHLQSARVCDPHDHQFDIQTQGSTFKRPPYLTEHACILIYHSPTRRHTASHPSLPKSEPKDPPNPPASNSLSITV
ncbi:hypothetical protein DFH09DRAFT_1470177 [Mycena vulgaris]|nr:hypothetical protein DFH09DRAFT_1470177 [Mycena vulgaris]